jgi:hypothetical protein
MPYESTWARAEVARLGGRSLASGGEGQRWIAAALAVSPEGQAVDAQGVGQQVQVLTPVSDGVGSPEPVGAGNSVGAGHAAFRYS